MIEGFASDVSLNDIPSFLEEEKQRKRRKAIIITSVIGLTVLILASAGVLVYFYVFRKKGDTPQPITPTPPTPTPTPPVVTKYEPVTLFANKDIVKCLVDERQVEIIRLENGLVTTLISVPNSAESGASLGVRVGHLMETDTHGLAHFVEHALFLGSKKYPGTSTYPDWITKYDGICNAFTSTFDTIFYFNLLRQGFDEALDMFSRMFNETLLPIEYVSKEVNAVNSEFLKNNGTDLWRRENLIEYFYGVSFGTGNNDTLGKIPAQELLDKVKVFIGKYYYATNMYLALYSNESISELKAKAVKYFSTITNKTTLKQEKTNKGVAFHSFGNIGWFQSLVNSPTLHFVFAVPFQNFKTDPLPFLDYLLTDLEKGSFVYEFKNLNYIMGIKVSENEKTSNSLSFLISVDLTNEGMNHLEEIIRGLFSFINTLKQQVKTLETVFKEMNHLNNHTFFFSEPSLQIKYVTYLMNKMKGDLSYLLHPFPTTQASFNETQINEVFGYLTPDNCLILIQSHIDMKDNDIKSKTADPNGFFTTVKHAPHFRTEHNIVKMNDKFMIELKKVFDLKRFSIRQVNPYISKERALITCEDTEEVCTKEREGIETQLLIKAPTSHVYYRLDRSFKYPKSFAGFHIMYPGLRSPHPDVRNKTLIFFENFLRNFNDKMDKAKEGGNIFEVFIDEKGLTFHVFAYNDIFPVIIKTFFTLLNTTKFTPQNFKQLSQITDSFKSQLDNEAPYVKGTRITSEILLMNTSKVFAPIKETVEELNALFTENNKHLIIDAVFSSSLGKDFTQRIYDESIAPYVHSSDKIAKEFNVTTTKEIIDTLHYSYKANGSYIYRARPSLKEQNHGIVNTYYACDISDKVSAMKAVLIEMAWGNFFFDLLRTQLQLGYTVQANSKLIGNRLYYEVLIQGAVRDPGIMNGIIDNAVMYSRKLLEAISPQILKELIRIVPNPQPMSMKAKQIFFLVSLAKRKLKTVNANDASEINRQDLLDFFDKVFIMNVSKLSVQLYNGNTTIEMPMVNETYSLNKEVTSIVSDDFDMMKKAEARAKKK